MQRTTLIQYNIRNIYSKSATVILTHHITTPESSHAPSPDRYH